MRKWAHNTGKKMRYQKYRVRTDAIHKECRYIHKSKRKKTTTTTTTSRKTKKKKKFSVKLERVENRYNGSVY